MLKTSALVILTFYMIVCYAFIGIILMWLDTMYQWGKPLTFSSCKEFTILDKDQKPFYDSWI